MKGLDRYITGNWGEDSVPDLPNECYVCPKELYRKCEFVKNIKGKPCDTIQAKFDKEVEEDKKMYDQMAKDFKEMDNIMEAPYFREDFLAQYRYDPETNEVIMYFKQPLPRLEATVLIELLASLIIDVSIVQSSVTKD